MTDINIRKKKTEIVNISYTQVDHVIIMLVKFGTVFWSLYRVSLQ